MKNLIGLGLAGVLSVSLMAASCQSGPADNHGVNPTPAPVHGSGRP